MRQRLQRSEEALAEDFAPSAERRREILQERARKLAIPRDKKDGRERLLIIEFSLAGGLYGVEACLAREVATLRDYSVVPGAPAFILGVASLRGRIVSVVDLKSFFDLPDAGLANRNKLIVIGDESRRMEFALLADEILDARELFADELQPPPTTFAGVRAEFARGVANGSLALLDAGRILSSRALLPFKIAQP